MGMLARGIRGVPRLVLFAGLLTLGSACSAPPKIQDAASLGLPIVERPAEATRGATRAFLGAATGILTITDAKATPLEAVAGAPLLADDKLILGADGLAVLIFTNGNVLRLNGPIEQELRGLAGFNSKAVGSDLEAQLVAALSDRDRERLSGTNERIGGWQLRLKAVEAPAPESEAKDAMAMEPPPEPKPEPAPAPSPADPAAQDDESADATVAADRGSGFGGAGAYGQGLGKNSAGKKDKKEKKEAGRSPSKTVAAQDDARPPADDSRGVGSQAGPQEELAGEDDSPKSSPNNSGDKEKPKLAPLSLAAASWIDTHVKISAPSGLIDELSTCLRPIPGTYVVVELTLRSGSITAIGVTNHSSPCAQSFKGKPFTGISKSGSVRLVFERR